MKAHPTDLASVMLPNTKAHGEAPGWHAVQKSEKEAAIALRSRLLQMIVSNEQSRAEEQSSKSQSNVLDPP